MTDADLSAKIVSWSEEDHCFVRSCPALFYGGCHGDKPKEVFATLCDLVAETIEFYRHDGRTLPSPNATYDWANKTQAATKDFREE